MPTSRKPLSRYTAPRYWPTWIGVGLLRLVCLLPFPLSLGIGRFFGRLVHGIGGKRRAIVRRNLELCFPDLGVDELDRLTRRHFEALGMGVIETGLARWASDRFHERVGRLVGLEHLERAVAGGHGVILLTGHFTTLEMSGRLLALHGPPFDAVYRKNRSDFITELQRTGREVSASSTIEKRNIKQMVRSLREGRPVWYAPDQSYDRKGAAVVEFFGVPCMHTTATSTLARLGRAVTLPFLPRRLDDSSYEFTILPPLEDFPGDDPVEDTRRFQRLLEAHVRLCPEQYFWVHRKFKNLPPEYPDVYADLDASK